MNQSQNQINTKPMEEKAAQALDQAKQLLHEKVDSVRGQLQNAGEIIQEKVAQAQENAAEKGKDLLEQVHHSADQAVQGVGQTVSQMAERLEEHAPNQNVTALAQQLKQGGDYLSGHSLSEMGQDAEKFIRKNPLVSLGVGFAFGLLLGAAFQNRRPAA